MKQQLKETINDPITQTIAETIPKAGVGFLGSFAAMTINDWVGLFVGLATLVYLGYQIEGAIYRRKLRNEEKI